MSDERAGRIMRAVDEWGRAWVGRGFALTDGTIGRADMLTMAHDLRHRIQSIDGAGAVLRVGGRYGAAWVETWAPDRRPGDEPGILDIRFDPARRSIDLSGHLVGLWFGDGEPDAATRW